MKPLEEEMMATYDLYDSGANLQYTRGDDNKVLLGVVPPTPLEAEQALGPGAYRDIFAASEAAGAPVTEQEVAGTLGGVVPGAAIGVGTGIQDIGALAYGGIKAATAEEGQRIDDFLKGFSAISGVIGSEKAFELYDAGVDMLPISDEAKQGLKQGAMVGEVIGFGGTAAKTGKATVEAAADYAAGAPGRIADRTSGTMLGANVDPTAIVDEAIVAGQKLMDGGKVAKVAPPTPDEPGIIAFHGSGADFDEFRLEMIGTGEGAQAYGYGLYFSDSEDIAKFYRDAVGGKNINRMKQFDDIGQALKGKMTLTTDIINNIIDKKIKVSSLPKEARSSVKEILKRKEPPTPKKMYKVGLAPNPDDMLNYQTTFADQPKKVQDALKAIGYEVEKNLVGQKNPKSQIDLAMRRPMPTILDSLKGRIIEDIRSGKQEPGRADKILSEKLLEQGVPGVKYRAAGSRGASIDAADVKMNYVIFDDKAIKILEKYGIVGPVSVSAIAGARQQNSDQVKEDEEI